MILSKFSETISKIKVKPMPMQVDIRKTFLYKWGKEEGLKEGEQRGLIKGLKQGKQEGLKEFNNKSLKSFALFHTGNFLFLLRFNNGFLP
jgi:predicted transposase YdaD